MKFTVLKKQYAEMVKGFDLINRDTNCDLKYAVVNALYSNLADLLRREFMRVIVESPKLVMTHKKRIVNALNKAWGLDGKKATAYYLVEDRTLAYNVIMRTEKGYAYLLPSDTNVDNYFCTIGMPDFPRDTWRQRIIELDTLEVLTAKEAVARAKRAIKARNTAKTAISRAIDAYQHSAKINGFNGYLSEHKYFNVDYPQASSWAYRQLEYAERGEW